HSCCQRVVVEDDGEGCIGKHLAAGSAFGAGQDFRPILRNAPISLRQCVIEDLRPLRFRVQEGKEHHIPQLFPGKRLSGQGGRGKVAHHVALCFAGGGNAVLLIIGIHPRLIDPALIQGVLD
ncbi:DUF2726 domain-containing protein, partial [Dysosmobacter welbionis]